ncbi:MAG: Crp/Fnr family transcriptional regulator [Bdellovibrionales bacterium]
MDETKLLIFSLLSGLQREKGYALLSRTTSALGEREAFDAQAARNEAILSQIRHSDLPQSIFLPQRIIQSFTLRSDTAFSESMSRQALAEWYLYQLQQPIHQTALALMVEWKGLTPSGISALIHFLAALSYLEQLRDAGLTIYGRGEISASAPARMQTLARAYLARERLFLNIADEKLRRSMHDLKLDNPESQIILDDFLHKLKEGYAKGLIASTPIAVWFHGFDAPLEAFYKTLIKTLEKASLNDEKNESFGNLVNALDSDIENSFHFIANMPLFRGVTENALRNVLKSAKILTLEKNQPLIMQDEPVSRFYVIMKGMAKSYKSAEEGSEVILQILTAKDCLVDMGLSQNVATISVRTVTESKVLSLSLPILREQITRQQNLARNMMQIISDRLQNSVAHFEQITLHDALHRVGWFLVNLHLDTGLEGAPLKLPFEKALIAAYLNIKPETFSRVLKQFKKKGFQINKDEVILPYPQALCEFCDPEMALHCCRAEAIGCAPIRIAKGIEETHKQQRKAPASE